LNYSLIIQLANQLSNSPLGNTCNMSGYDCLTFFSDGSNWFNISND